MNIVDGRNPKGEIGQSLLPDLKVEIGQSLVPRAKGKIVQRPVAQTAAPGNPIETREDFAGNPGSQVQRTPAGSSG